MSQNLENLFKESLQNLDAPYNPQAWDALQSKLDAAMPVATPKKPFNIWKASAIVVGVVGVSTVLYLLSSSPIKEETKTETKVASEKSAATNETIGSTSENVTEKNRNTEATEFIGKSASKPISKSNSASTFVAPSSSTKKVEPTVQNSTIGELPTQVPPVLNSKTPEIDGNDNLIAVSIPAIAKQCQNEKIKISNTNSTGLIVTFPSGKKETIAAKKQATINLTEGGVYTISDSKSIKEKTFLVNTTPEPDFEIDQMNIFKNGLPSTAVNTTTIASNYNWSCNQNNLVLSGKENEFHFFKEGRYTIDLVVTDQNGCKSSVSKEVNIASDYNLMAGNAFNPLHNDSRRNTFMPFALTQRNTAFNLIIIDPKDGGTVYKTADASAGWDGIDIRTGNMALNGTSYIWKVTISNPVAGENDNYKGVVLVTR